VQGEDVARQEDGDARAEGGGEEFESLEVDGCAGGGGAGAWVDGEEVDVAVVVGAEDGGDEVDCFSAK
jgi:hypothetical protein